MNFYEILQVHPAAPLDLISAAYWRLVSRAQESRGKGATGDLALHQLTKGYQALSDAALRAEYDAALGLAERPVVPDLRRPRRSGRRRLFSRSPDTGRLPDYYEILRVDRRADPLLISDAYDVMRNYYIRLVRMAEAPPQLISLLQDAYSVLSDAARRRAYDAQLTGGLDDGQTAEAPEEAPEPGDPDSQAPVEEERPPSVRAQQPEAREEADVREAEPTPRLLQALAAGFSSGAAVARGLVVAGERRLAVAAPAAARRLTAAASLLWKRLREAARRWWEEAAERVRAAKAARAARVAASEEPLPAEEEAVLARLRAGSNGELRGIEQFPMRAYLTLVHDSSGERSFEVNHSPLVLGGDGQSDIPLPNTASEEARLVYREGQFILFSVRDVRGIRLDGEAVAWAVLEHGTEVGIGPYTIRFHVVPK